MHSSYTICKNRYNEVSSKIMKSVQQEKSLTDVL